MSHVLVGLLRDEVLHLKRYWLNTVSATVFGYLIFLLVLFGVRTSLGGQASLGETTESLVVAYWVVLLTNLAFQGVGSYIYGQAMMGTLEHLYLSPFGFGWIAFCKMLANLLTNLVLNVPFLLLMMATTGKWLHIDVLSILPLVAVAVIQAYGIGFGISGLVLIYKRLQALDQVVTMLLVVCIAAPAGLMPLVRWLPLNLAWRLLRSVMADGVPLWRLPGADLLFVALQTGAIFAAGWYLYRGCERVVRRQGLLGQY